MAAVKKVVKKRRELKNVDKGQVHIQSSFNNTIVTVTDANGNAISQSSAGALGYKGSRKSTPFAAQQAAETAAKAAMEHGLRSVEVFVKGPGQGRESAIRALGNVGLEVTLISDIQTQNAAYADAKAESCSLKATNVTRRPARSRNVPLLPVSTAQTERRFPNTDSNFVKNKRLKEFTAYSKFSSESITKKPIK